MAVVDLLGVFFDDLTAIEVDDESHHFDRVQRSDLPVVVVHLGFVILVRSVPR